MEDVELVARAREGDVQAFEALVERHRDAVYGLCVRLLRSPADAAEATQDAFLKAFTSLNEFRGEAAFASWLYRIAANFALMRLRKRTTRNEVEEPLEGPQFNERGSLIESVIDPGPTAEGQLIDEELKKAIEEATDKLPETHRQVFLLRDVEGLSYEAIAELIQESVPAVKSRLHRARLALRASIDRFYEAADG